MIDFRDEAPDDAARPGLRLIRTPGKEKLEGVITTTRMVGCFTHFWNRRTLPHDEVFCEACQANNPKRWHGWVGLWLPRLKEQAIFEMPAQATLVLKKYFAAEKTLRGARLAAWRPSQTDNGRVTLRVERWAQTLDELPHEFDLIGALVTIWGLPQQQPALDTSAERIEGLKNFKTKASKNGAHI